MRRNSINRCGNRPQPCKKSIQNLSFQTLAQAQNILKSIWPQFSANANQVSRESISGNENGNESVASTSRRNLKLPQTVLPTFSGKMEEWLSFKDTFRTMIHNHNDLPNVEKLQYLKSVLKDEALRKIQVFSITEENYDRAWSLLEKSYEDKRSLISRHLSLLLRLPVQEEEYYKGLITLADESQQHLQSLATLGVNLSPEIVVAIIEEKLHKFTLEKWDETIKKGEFPKLDDLVDFLYRIAACLSKRVARDCNTVSNTDKDPYPDKKRKIGSKRQVLLTSITRKCPLCSDSHLLFKCGKFLKLTVNERFKIVKSASLCFNCLRNHSAKECKFGSCKKCGKRHNTLLHFTKPHEQNDPKET
ncbi:uncharacterized protein LOC117173861 [Belonocnema kinseyi]|uniref:uncharacterized protein LOC117173861 n=1 Tax=Belonocnema kinseyi TaxID=2817044 RepID=UPI00143D7BFD|nr:uncharacterized protein LOC117173861 [Belonocnema kinseyi]